MAACWNTTKGCFVSLITRSPPPSFAPPTGYFLVLFPSRGQGKGRKAAAREEGKQEITGNHHPLCLPPSRSHPFNILRNSTRNSPCSLWSLVLGRTSFSSLKEVIVPLRSLLPHGYL